MSDFRLIMAKADSAKIAMVSNRIEGEKLFDDLLKQNPTDGMIFYKRGEAYEALGENTLAAKDYQLANAFFPMPEWKGRASAAYNRMKK